MKVKIVCTMIPSGLSLYKRPLPSPPAVDFTSAEGQVRITSSYRSSVSFKTVCAMKPSGLSLYKRLLPSPAVDFTSAEGQQLFGEALANGTMKGFCKLISQFQTQSETSYCGLASLAMVLNALSIDPGRKWKGPWRWFDESMLDFGKPLEKIRAEGLSLRDAMRLAHGAGANVEAFPTDETSIDKLRKFVVECSSSSEGEGSCHMISLYDRRVLNQTGAGHFSPIGGYHANKDMVLILDVARFKYPPHWVRLSNLWEAMDTVVKSTGQHRGFLLVSTNQTPSCALHTQPPPLDSVNPDSL